MEIKFTIDTLFIVIGTLLVILLILRYVPFGLYFQCILTKVEMPLLSLIFMRIRGTNPSIIVNSMIIAKQVGIELDPAFLEAHSLAGGNVRNLTEGIIYAKNKNVFIDYKYLSKADLKQKDIKQLINKFIENKAYYGNDYSIEGLI